MFKLKKDQFRLICYLIVFCAIASFPVRQILAFEYPEIPPKEYIEQNIDFFYSYISVESKWFTNLCK